MRNIIIFLLMLMPFTCYSQNILDIGTIWYEFEEDEGIWTANRHSYVKKQVIADTLIGSHQYYVLQNIHLDSVLNQMQGTIVSVSVSIDYTYWRDSAHKMYRYIPATGTDSLCYDFTRQVNDYMVPNYTNCLINYIDTIYIGSLALKRFRRDSVSDPFSDFYATMIEGIGMLSSLENPFVCGAIFEETRAICCYTNQYGTISFSQNYAWLPQMCGMSLVNETQVNPISVIVYPNPSQSVFSILTDEVMKNGNAMLFNSLGDKVLEMPIEGKETVIYTSSLGKGVYLLCISNLSGIASFKVLVE